MADDFSQDMLGTKAPKRSPIVLRMVMLAFAAVFGVYSCFICLRQIRTHVDLKDIPLYTNVQLNVEHCQISGIQPKESLYLHFPEPKAYSRDECICNPVHFFAILSMQRSGSGWFETLLNSHLNVSSNGELFSVKPRRSNISAVLSTLEKVYNLDWYSSAAKNECSAAVGFKWMLNQGVLAYHDEIVDYFNSKGVSAVFLFRRNLLSRMISILANNYDHGAKQLNGTHKSHVHSKTEAKVLAKFKPTINITLLLPELEHAEEMATNALNYFNKTRHIVLFYEDLVKNLTKLQDVQDFLYLPRRELESRQVKIHTKPLSKQVSNWDDVCEKLKGTKYERFLKGT
eukprot:TRINITY_DN7272_c1_g1_i12.p1 TRINITY_DN7272_c1_g1~~TRINITY_DN7272_c1_g1_i12.p1  ORF type:complete len:343 (-),score=57.24 TRINITY_DN7272_c1_g1_i12:304-1332(-)